MNLTLRNVISYAFCFVYGLSFSVMTKWYTIYINVTITVYIYVTITVYIDVTVYILPLPYHCQYLVRSHARIPCRSKMLLRFTQPISNADDQSIWTPLRMGLYTQREEYFIIGVYSRRGIYNHDKYLRHRHIDVCNCRWINDLAIRDDVILRLDICAIFLSFSYIK